MPSEGAAMISKVLVVDDSSVMHSMYSMMFRHYDGCTVVHATNGREALDLLGQNADCQLILLDINMPVMSGLEFMEEYRSRNAAKKTPVIIVSTMGKEQDTRRGIEAGAAAYLTKPFQPNDLHTLITKVLGIKTKARGQV